MKEKPLVSLITVSFNSEKYIKDTIESILNQSYPYIEYIIIDGESTDRTLSIIQSYEEQFNGRMKWISERDKGIYDAMNKGVKMASGEIIGILNSDDIYKYKDVIQQVVDKFIVEEADCLYADLEFVDPQNTNKVVRRWNANWGSFRNGWNPPHPTTFIKRGIYEKFGLYKVDYKLASDYDLLYRIIHKGKVKTVYFNKSIVQMRLGGASTSGVRSNFIASKEIYKTLKENNEKYKFLIIIIRLVRKIKQYI